MNCDNTFVRIDLDAIRENLIRVGEKTGVQVCAVVKADAYGHGAVEVARHLQPDCAFFGVSSAAEAMELRHGGIEKPILILGHTPPECFAQAVAFDIRVAIFKWQDAQALSAEAVRQGKTAHIHLAVDTGMGRIGFEPDEASARICADIARLPGLHVEGLFSHFATADADDLSFAREQAKRFDAFYALLQANGVEVPLRHLNNSAGLMNFSAQYEMVRSGIITYGLYPSEQVDPALLPLKPALSWYSRISHIKELPAGRSISYGATYVTIAPTRVATVTVGYADGYSRSLSGKFYVLIRGKKAPILGRVCMDQMMVDVTGIPDVELSDPVTLVGTDGDETITMEQIAAQAGSFNYEFLCSIGRRVPRLYYRHGALVHSVHYLLDNQ